MLILHKKNCECGEKLKAMWLAMQVHTNIKQYYTLNQQANKFFCNNNITM